VAGLKRRFGFHLRKHLSKSKGKGKGRAAMSSAPGIDESKHEGREGVGKESESKSQAADDLLRRGSSVARVGSVMPQLSQTTIGEELSRDSLFTEEDFARGGSSVVRGGSLVAQISEESVGENLSRESLRMSDESPRQGKEQDQQQQQQQRPEFGDREYLLMGSPPEAAAAAAHSYFGADVDGIQPRMPSTTGLMSPVASDDDGEVDKSDDPWEYQGDRDDEGNPHGIGYCVYRGEILQHCMVCGLTLVRVCVFYYCHYFILFYC